MGYFSELGGYEYDAEKEELIIKILPGPLHEGVIEVFSDWLTRLKDSGDLKQHGKLKHRSNQGLPSHLFIYVQRVSNRLE